MQSFTEQARFYAQCHQKPITLYTHFVGIPLIIFAVMVLLGFIKIVIPGVFEISIATIATLLVLIYYFYLQWKLALAITPILIFLLWIAHWFSYLGPTKVGLWAFGLTFVLGWALQLVGHIIEDKKPAFVSNLCQLVIAPLYLVAELFFMMNWLPELQAEIHQ